MLEFIISEATSIFLKAIKRYAKEQNVEENEISISLYLDEEEEVAYYLMVHHLQIHYYLTVHHCLPYQNNMHLS